MSFPDIVTVFNIDGHLIERRTTRSTFVSPSPENEYSFIAEFVMSDGPIEEVGLYCDVFYYKPTERTEEESLCAKDEALYELRVQHFARVWYVTPNEARNVVSIMEQTSPIAVRIDGDLVDLRQLSLLSQRYVSSADSLSIAERVASLYRAMKAEYTAMGHTGDIDAEIAKDMHIKPDVLLGFLAVDAADDESCVCVDDEEVNALHSLSDTEVSA